MTTKENILSILSSHKRELSQFGISNIGLFGSYLRNEQTPKSDIDLLISAAVGTKYYKLQATAQF